ncbi:MAG: hypothetical protein ABR541_00205 [Candidatus Dormibacteria bacterium]
MLSLDSLAMGMLSRLFGSRTPAPPPAVVATEPARHRVLVPDDLANQLTADGEPLQDAVERTLRRALEPARPADARPFWVERGEPSGDLSDELRDRVAQRRAAETEG